MGNYPCNFKDLILKMVKCWIYISNCVPWQVNKWTKHDRTNLQNENLFQDLDGDKQLIQV